MKALFSSKVTGRRVITRLDNRHGCVGEPSTLQRYTFVVAFLVEVLPRVIFTGIMNATRYTDIVDASLVPFITAHYPTGHRFQQDNDPKHTNCWAQNYFEENHISWWKTPASSPDLNPIEKVWGSMKTYLRTYVKPKNLQELKDGIKEYWLTLTP